MNIHIYIYNIYIYIYIVLDSPTYWDVCKPYTRIVGSMVYLLGRTYVLGLDPIEIRPNKTVCLTFICMVHYVSTVYILKHIYWVSVPRSGREIYPHRVLYIFCIFALHFAHALNRRPTTGARIF